MGTRVPVLKMRPLEQSHYATYYSAAIDALGQFEAACRATLMPERVHASEQACNEWDNAHQARMDALAEMREQLEREFHAVIAAKAVKEVA